MKDRKIMLALSIVALFFLIVSTFTLYVESRRPSKLDASVFEEMSVDEIIEYFQDKQESRPIPMFYFFPLVAFSGLLVGSLTYYILSEKIVVKEKQVENNTEIILKLLEPMEKLAIKKIIEEGGKVHQSEITYLPNMGKVKTHRILRKLEARGIIKKEKLGKIKLIKLEESIFNVLKERKDN